MSIRSQILAALRSSSPAAKSAGPIHAEERPQTVDGRLLIGKKVLITGAGKNIGKATALEMAVQGATVYFTDIEATTCCALEQQLKCFQAQSQGFVSDVSKKEDNDSLFEYFKANHITPDVVVNNVGISSAEFLTTFRTNVFGPMHLTGLFLRMMIENNVHGSIIFMTSIHQDTPRTEMTYSSSKAALEMIIKELSLEVAPHGIRVNGIAPGYVAEDGQGNPLPHEYTPLHRTSVTPQYVGRAAVYLASDYFSRYTTGTTLKIDAGLSLVNYFSFIWHRNDGS